ncbi:MAG: hypothetical protein ACLFUR_05320 [Candidatus Hadarchaeia archaeon]
MTSRKRLESKVESLEKNSRKSMSGGESNVAEALEEVEEELDEEDMFTEKKKFGDMGIEEVGEFLEFREKHLEEEEVGDSAGEKTLEKIIEELEDELKKKEKLEDIRKELVNEGCYSIEALKKGAKNRGIGNNFAVSWLDREGLLLEEFRKESCQ